MRILGLDVGSRTIGIALSDSLGIIAQGIETFRYKEDDFEAVIEHLDNLIRKYEIKTVVMGLPLHMNGDVSESALRVQELASELKDNSNVKIEFIDERLTTVQVTRTLLEADVSRKKRKTVVDKMAAVVILQTYLDLKGGQKNG